MGWESTRSSPLVNKATKLLESLHKGIISIKIQNSFARILVLHVSPILFFPQNVIPLASTNRRSPNSTPCSRMRSKILASSPARRSQTYPGLVTKTTQNTSQAPNRLMLHAALFLRPGSVFRGDVCNAIRGLNSGQ